MLVCVNARVVCVMHRSVANCGPSRRAAKSEVVLHQAGAPVCVCVYMCTKHVCALYVCVCLCVHFGSCVNSEHVVNIFQMTRIHVHYY